MRFQPKPVPGGASRVGNSYLSLFARCPRKWFGEYYRPLLDEAGSLVGRGLQPRLTPLALLSGRILHEGLAAWYLSGCRDGEDTGQYDVDHALDVAKVQWQRAAGMGEYESTEAGEQDWLRTEVMLRAYHDRFGPTSFSRDWPDLRVAHDHEGKPIVERELESALAPSYVYTCRPDLLVWHRGYLRVMEHKTSSARFVQEAKDRGRWGSQYAGECWVLREVLPDEPVHGVLINVLTKDRSLKSKWDVAERESANRTPAQLERWRRSALHLLASIDTAVAGFERSLAEGHSIEEAADLWFPTYGTNNGECHSYNRDCAFMELCSLPGLEQANLRKFRARSEEELRQLKEGVDPLVL